MHWEKFVFFFLIIFPSSLIFQRSDIFFSCTMICSIDTHLSLWPSLVLKANRNPLTIDSLQLFHIKFTFFFLLSLSNSFWHFSFNWERQEQDQKENGQIPFSSVDLYTYLNLREKYQSRTADDEKDGRLVYLLVVKPCAIFQSF